MIFLSLINPLDIICHVTTKYVTVDIIYHVTMKYVTVPKLKIFHQLNPPLHLDWGKDAAEKEQNI